MRNLKRTLSLALASVMLLGMMVVGTSAASYPDVTSENNVEAIEVIKAVGVMEGNEKGEFEPAKAVTRNEMAVVMANMMDLKVADYAGTCIFTDVPDWAKNFVAACYANGIVSGTGATTYNGDDTVTAAQAALMMMKALGYFQYQSDFGDDWQLATVKQASKISLLKSISAGADSALTRNDVAQLGLNTLKANVVEAKKSGSNITIGDITISADVEYIDYVVANGTAANDAISSTQDAAGKDIVQLGEKLYEGDLVLTTTSIVDDMKRPAVKWAYDGDEVGVYASAASKTFVIDSTSGTKAVLATWLKEQNKNYTNMDATSTAALTYTNGGTAAAYQPKLGDVVEVFVTSSAPNTITDIVVSQYKLAKITKVDTNISTADKENDVTCKLTLKDAAGTVIATLKDTDVAGFAASTYVKDAYLAVALKSGNTKVLDSYVVTAAAEGSMSGVNGAKYTMSGKTYEAVGVNFVEDYTEGDYTGTYAIYTDAKGFALGIVEIEADSVASDAVYVTKLWDDTSENEFKEKVTTTYAQIVDMTGVAKTIVVGYTTIKGEIFGVDKAGASYTKIAKPAAASDIETSHYYVPISGTNAGEIFPCTVDTAPTDAYGYNATYANNTTKFYTKNTGAVAANKLYTMAGKEDDTYYAMTAYTEKVGTQASGATIKSDASKLGAYYVNSATKYIVVEGSGSNVKVTTKEGGLSYTGDSVTATVIYTTSGTANVASYVILPVATYTAADSEDLFYVKSQDGTVDGGYACTVYLSDGTTKSIVVKDDPTDLKNKFVSYKVDTKDVYTLTQYSTAPTFDGADWEDSDVGVQLGATYVSRYEGVTLSNGTNTLLDIDAANAVVVDKHETDNDAYQFDGKKFGRETFSGIVDSIDAMDAATDSGYTVTLDVSIDEDGVVIAFVQDVSRVIVTAAVTTGSITVSSVDVKGTDVIAHVSAAGDNDNVVTFTFTAPAGGSTAGNVTTKTVTKSGGSWPNNDTLAITGADGTTNTTFTFKVVTP